MREGGPRPEGARPEGRRDGAREGAREGAPANQAGAAPAAAAAAKKKKRRLRTKQCAKCMTPCLLLTRCRIKPGQGHILICDICWWTWCDDNPHYEYGGTWYNGRVLDPSVPGSVNPRGGVGHAHIQGPRLVQRGPNPTSGPAPEGGAEHGAELGSDNGLLESADGGDDDGEDGDA